MNPAERSLVAVLAGMLPLLGLLVAACGAPQAASSPGSVTPGPALPTASMTAVSPPSQTPEPPPASETPPQATLVRTPTSTTNAQAGDAMQADVLSVDVRGQEGSYQFSVQVRSPDTGCEQFADWWEVLSPDGELLYRRILLHSHVGEQPFTRSGGPVAIAPGETVIVRAHMKASGYGGAALQGSPGSGFEQVSLPGGFASDLEQVEPLPQGCAF